MAKKPYRPIHKTECRTSVVLSLGDNVTDSAVVNVATLIGPQEGSGGSSFTVQMRFNLPEGAVLADAEAAKQTARNEAIASLRAMIKALQQGT